MAYFFLLVSCCDANTLLTVPLFRVFILNKLQNCLNLELVFSLHLNKKLNSPFLVDQKQKPDAALGNGGLGRLASFFWDSLATINYPAWGYVLRYKFGLFKPITKDGQEEVAEDWLSV